MEPWGDLWGESGHIRLALQRIEFTSSFSKNELVNDEKEINWIYLAIAYMN